MGYSVGRSSFGDLNGVEQFVSTLIVAQQVASLCYEFDTQFPGARGRGDRLTVNEGIRSKRRMELLRAAWETYLRDGHPWAALAAALYFSTHREEIGTALDFGITRKDGTNRAMTAAEAQWVHDHGPARGIRWTGQFFNPQESWHHNGGYAYTLPPITGVNLPGAPFFTDVAETHEQIRRALMAAKDTLTYYQRTEGGKDQDVYFIAGGGVFLDLERRGEKSNTSWIVKRTGLDSRAIRVLMNAEGINAVKLDARAYDERRIFYAAISEAALGAAVGK
ncbi:hypothetical protein Csp2054_09150 [Curtobacterium sp. 'Ferrero']|uniref:hypothetical protein n=1 Tax=Curtobacterium sp. 'Ferrero' TaxID=2033654 RepID=UPI000BC48BD7|nr:hypothetical protein [Curtobacterium sp. 'Ferrero']PCN48030.1 hypothetical protein Csp2054_09150 [Curtobacterium sp. 'Ferrero']